MAAPDPAAANDAEEDDYMSMAIADPVAPTARETYTQQRRRKEREAWARGRTKPKAELEAEAALARDVALSRSLLADPATAGSNKGLKMMARMGFRPGEVLGKEGGGGRKEPLGISVKEDRGGVGMDSERKRRFREEVEDGVKRVKEEEGGFRERRAREREGVRVEGMLAAAMRVAERMAGEREEEVEAEDVAKPGNEEENGKKKKRTISTKPLKTINVLWRGLVRAREETERDRRMRYDLHQSLSRLPTYDDPDEDQEDKSALGKNLVRHALVEDLEEEDPELDAFDALEPAEKLRQLVAFLRAEYNYCFWCKFTYPDREMEGCPGITEEDHD